VALVEQEKGKSCAAAVVTEMAENGAILPCDRRRAAEISAYCGLIPRDSRHARGRAPFGPLASFLNSGQSVNSTPTVLVVDDEPLVRWSVAETLVDCGYAVTQAGDALQALESVKAAPADVVLLDVSLSDSSDLNLVSVMRRVSPNSKIILMTAYGSKALSDEARSRGAFGVLDKPFDMSVLPPLVAEALAA